MQISIIVLFHNNNRFYLTINSLLKQMGNEDEIIIVDDHSDDDFLSQLKAYENMLNIKIIHSDKIGNRSYNRNIGAALSNYPHLLFVDGDIVLLDNCLFLIKMALNSGYVGAFGNILQGGDTPEQMTLKVGFDYLNFLEKNPQIEDFFNIGMGYDKRSSRISENIVNHNEWQFFYSGYCAATKDAFIKCGGFNESFQGWGAEDVEFGYRLSQCGDLKFVHEAYAYHISYQRDLFKIMQNNKKNIYLFFYQQTNPLLELFLTFHLSTKIISTMDYIKSKVKTMNLCSKHMVDAVGEISVLPVSDQYPNGSIAYFSEDCILTTIDLMGMALPFNDSQFTCANLTTDILCYPEMIAAKILQECLRVADVVKIYKTTQRKHILWNEMSMHMLTSLSSTMDRTDYHAYMLNDFTFQDMGKYYVIVGGVVTQMPYVHIDNLPNVYTRSNCEIKKYMVFDLTNGVPQHRLSQILKDNGICSNGVYHIPSPSHKLCLSELIYGELQLLHIPFAYIIDDQSSIDKSDIWWKYTTRHCDKIIVYQDKE